MSAIWGTVSFHAELPDQVSPDMRRPFEKYRIDRFQEHTCPQVYMGCGIQFITPQSEKEPLPIYDQVHQLLFTADCYLDNRNDLLRELSPEDSSVPDGMLMYLGYLKWGMDCLTHFLGAFSMALYRLDTQTLYLASDPVASRCLYYYQGPAGMSFSTLLRPIKIMHPELKQNSLFQKDFLCAPYMVSTLTPRDTPWENVWKLPPATWVELREGEARSHSYWDPLSRDLPYKPRNAREWGDAFLKLYRQCVGQILYTHENAAIALSSGLDSASVGALAAEHLQHLGKKLYAYTYVPHIQPDRSSRFQINDETQGVREMAALYPNLIPHFLDNGGRNAFRFIREEVDTMEVPFKAFVNMPNLLEIGEQARKDGCRILLTGQYGNSTVSYGEFSHILYDAYARHRPYRFLHLINSHGKALKFSRKKLLHNALHQFRDCKPPQDFCHAPDNPFLSPCILDNYPAEERFRLGMQDQMHYQFFSCDQYRKTCFFPAVLSYLGELETKSSLLHGILLRDPTRDPRIMQFCTHLPYALFCHQGIPRWLIRGNFRELLPPSLLTHWHSRGVQNADWHNRILRDWDSIIPELTQTLATSPFRTFFQWEKIQTFLQNAGRNPDSVDFIQLKYLFYLYIFTLSIH